MFYLCIFSAGFLPISGGQLTNWSIMRNKNDEGLTLCGGSSLYYGAHLELYGKDFSAANGAFKLSTIRADGGSINLFGNGSGELWWMGNDLAGAAIAAKNLAVNGYIKFANGLIFQWIYLDASADLNKWDSTGCRYNYSFPIKFPNTTLFGTGQATSTSGGVVCGGSYQNISSAQNAYSDIYTATLNLHTGILSRGICSVCIYLIGF